MLEHHLKEAKILVTRPVHQAEKLCHLIRINHGIPVAFPTVEIVPLTLNHKESDNYLKLADRIIFTSTNAVRCYCSQLDNAKISKLKTKSCLAIGEATRQALMIEGLNIDLMPKQGYNSEALLELSVLQVVSQQTIVIIRGENGREILAETLRERGATIYYQDVYRRTTPAIKAFEVSQLIAQKQLALITITSGETLQNLVKMLPDVRQSLLKQIPLIVVSDRVQTIAKNLGFEHIILAPMPSDDAIFKTITTIINGEESG